MRINDELRQALRQLGVNGTKNKRVHCTFGENLSTTTSTKYRVNKKGDLITFNKAIF